MSKPSDKQESGRKRIIKWYKEDIYDYNRKIAKYSNLINTIRERIDALEKKELEEYDTTRELLTES